MKANGKKRVHELMNWRPFVRLFKPIHNHCYSIIRKSDSRIPIWWDLRGRIL